MSGEESQSTLPLHTSGERCTKWNYSFTWTPQHFQRAETDPLRYQYDELGTKSLERLQAIVAAHQQAGKMPVKPDLYTVLRDHRTEDPVLTEFWESMHTIPEWVDWEQVERGQKFLYRYAMGNFTGFALQGFVGENSAAAGVIEVLVRTGGFSTRVLFHRLLETFQWLLQATVSVDAIKPGGEGHTSSIRVRLLHASVRQRIMQITREHPDYFDISTFGVPANALDSIHSITTFAVNHSLLQLPRMGVNPPENEVADYIALFRYLAYLLGTPTEYFDSAEKAKALAESLFLHELVPTPTSKVVGFNFVKCLEGLAPFDLSVDFIEAGSRWMCGHELCDELGFGRPGWSAYASFAGLCCVVTVMAWVQWMIPAVDAWLIEYWRKTLYEVIIKSKAGLKGGSKFHFRHVPQYGKMVGTETIERESKPMWGIPRPVEKFYLLCFVSTVAVVLGGTVGLWRLTHALWCQIAF